MADYSKLAGTLAGAPLAAGQAVGAYRAPNPARPMGDVSPGNRAFFNRIYPTSAPQAAGSMNIPNANIDPGFTNPSLNSASPNTMQWNVPSGMTPQAMQFAYQKMQPSQGSTQIQDMSQGMQNAVAPYLGGGQQAQQPTGQPNYTGIMQGMRHDQGAGALQDMRPNVSAYLRSASYRQNHPMPRALANTMNMANSGAATPAGMSPKMMNYWKIK